MAYNLSAAIRSTVTTAANTITASVNTVSQDFTSATNRLSQGISTATGLSTQKVNSALLGGTLGAIIDGKKGAVFGALAGGLFGGNNSNIEELQGIIEQPLKIVPKGLAELKGITGDAGLILNQYNELADRSAITSEFVDSGFMPSYNGDDSSASKVPNPLREYDSFNYVITLGVLDAESYNNPETYRKMGFKNYIIKSSGGDLGRRYQVYDEKVGNTGGVPQLGHLGTEDHAEYYIDDIELDSVVAPNPTTRMTLGTALSFSVTEPYSMGNFIQAVIGSASDAGYGSYTDAPFCLRIDFAGFQEVGTQSGYDEIKPQSKQIEPIFVPIKLINMEFNVSGSGSKYAVTAVPMSEVGLSDEIDKIKTPISATGLLCSEILETNDSSITNAINGQIEDLEKVGALSPYDRYVICFPKNRDALRNAYQKREINETAFTTTATDLEIQRQGTLDKNPDIQSSYSPTTIKITPPNDTYAILKSFAENTDLMNAIGKSPVTEDTNAPGNTAAADIQSSTNPETNQVDPASLAAQPADKAREYQFNQGQKITSIIERMVVQTTYAAEKSTEGAKNGMNKWFRIDTHVYLDESPATENTMGRRPRVYVYSVIEYEVDQAVTMPPNQAPQNTAGLRKLAQKQYNYIYTGKNEDVLSFDLKFNNAFMMTAFADLGMGNAPIRAATDLAKTTSSNEGTVSGATIAPPNNKKTADEATGEVSLVTSVKESPGTVSNDIRRKIAEVFHDRITNMNVDMVTADMEIVGDPYFIPQQTGNHVSAKGNSPAVTADGTMNYLDQTVFCIINFQTPFDYQVTGATMEQPQIVAGFSGLFQVWAVTNSFSSGKFTQTLKLIRRKGQDDEATTTNSGTMVENDNSKLTRDGPQGRGDRTAGDPDCLPAARDDVVTNLLPALTSDLDTADKITPRVGIGSVSSARVRGAMGSILPYDAMNALDVLAEEAAIINQAAAAAKGTLNAVTDATKSRVKNLLGPF